MTLLNCFIPFSLEGEESCVGLYLLLLTIQNSLSLTPNLYFLQAFQVKNNISRFSGFVWHENEVKKERYMFEKGT
ncbi:hypothetical protein CK203_011946 [Vitis vinifera]|uniref:Uncharacterized protein n=1 Tax=Vitis vinifera TaxID=29760 RepID=A0A438K078_VITVI|nr:hypothetical protein CK203_087998 [Vitis vinifera]RVX14616.1 hypothetical protein CK203_011946 [Vitis vinifera]